MIDVFFHMKKIQHQANKSCLSHYSSKFYKRKYFILNLIGEDVGFKNVRNSIFIKFLNCLEKANLILVTFFLI